MLAKEIEVTCGNTVWILVRNKKISDKNYP